MKMKTGGSATGHKMPMKGEPGKMMEHEMPMAPAEDNVMHTSHMMRGSMHPDSKGSDGMDGCGPKGQHWSGK